MIKTLTLPIKGTFYYSADEAEQAGLLIRHRLLSLKAEPDNAFDGYAIQIWLNSFKQLLLGYIPRTHSKWISFLLQHQHIHQVEIVSSYRQFNRLHIDIQIHYQSTLLLRLLFIWHWLTSSRSLKKSR